MSEKNLQEWLKKRDLKEEQQHTHNLDENIELIGYNKIKLLKKYKILF